MSNFQPDPDDLFDDRLRVNYDAPGEEAAAPPPVPGAWAGVEARLRPRARPGRPLAAGLFGLITGVLLMGWWNYAPTLPAENQGAITQLAERSAAAALLPPTRVSRGAPVMEAAKPQSHSTAASSVAEKSLPKLFAVPAAPALATAATSAATSAAVAPSLLSAAPAAPAVSAAPAVPAAAPGTSLPASAPSVAPVLALDLPAVAALLPLIHAETTYAGLAGDSSRVTRRAALRAERAALVGLAQRVDSLLLALGEPAAAPALSVAPHDSAPAPLRRRWSVLLAGAPERSFLDLQAPAADTVAALRRTHEQGRGGWNAALLAEYRLSRRWSVAVGAGLSTTGAELRLTDRHTVVDVLYDTLITKAQRLDSVTTTSYIVNPDSVVQLDPRYNITGQVVRFDTSWVSYPDTIWTVTSSSLLTTSTNKTVTPLISRHEEVRARVLRPNYRFLTVPLLVRYRLGRPTDWTSSPTAPRWWADVAVGAQLQWFLGGTHLVTTDGGHTFRTERVGRHEGAFRPLNVAVLGQVALNYALTPRLSGSVAPTVRWQAQSVYRASTGLTQRPTATGVQFGLRYSF